MGPRGASPRQGSRLPGIGHRDRITWAWPIPGVGRAPSFARSFAPRGSHARTDQLQPAGPRPAGHGSPGPRGPRPSGLRGIPRPEAARGQGDGRAQPRAVRPAPAAASYPRRRPPCHPDPPVPGRRAGPARRVPPRRRADGPGRLGRARTGRARGGRRPPRRHAQAQRGVDPGERWLRARRQPAARPRAGGHEFHAHPLQGHDPAPIAVDPGSR